MKLLTNHEVRYFLKHAEEPPETVKDVLTEEVAIWRMDSPKLIYTWQLYTNKEFDRIWIEYKITGVDRLEASHKVLQGDFLIPEHRYTYECSDV